MNFQPHNLAPYNQTPHNMLRTLFRYLVAGALLAGGHAASASPAIEGGTLGDLILPHTGRIAHYASTDAKGRNADSRRIPPGQTLTLLDHKGAGIVRRWWVTVAPFNNPVLQRNLIVRCYWDGEQDPSVEVPLSDFFGVGFGEWHQYQSVPLNMTSGGYNCYWAMPFRREARITIENRSKLRVDGFYYNVDIETHDPSEIPDPTLYFHAQFRRTNPTERGKPVTILEAEGSGHYVGTLLSMQSLTSHRLWYLEGNERISVDGETTPSIVGTGTEDYFSSGWYFNTGTYSSPYHGVTIKDEATSRVSAYRWHIEDPIPFQKSLRFEIEHGGLNEIASDYTSVAYWYQTHPHLPFPPLPSDLMPAAPATIPRIEGLIEGEALVPVSHATEGAVTVQPMDAYRGTWSGADQLFWCPKSVGSTLTLTVSTSQAGTYELLGYFTRARDYGNVRLTVNGQTLDTVVHGYGQGVTSTGPVSFGRVPLQNGANTLTLEVVGKDSSSSGYLVGLDGFLLKSQDGR